MPTRTRIASQSRTVIVIVASNEGNATRTDDSDHNDDNTAGLDTIIGQPSRNRIGVKEPPCPKIIVNVRR